MVSYALGRAAVYMLIGSPAFVLPLIIGIRILLVYRGTPLGRMAGLLTLKPLLATPLWFVMLAVGARLYLSRASLALLSLIPGIGLTLLIVWACKHAFGTDAQIARLLMGADALRWLNSGFYIYFADTVPLLLLFSLPVGLILPSAYAVIALALLVRRPRPPEQPAQNSG